MQEKVRISSQFERLRVGNGVGDVDNRLAVGMESVSERTGVIVREELGFDAVSAKAEGFLLVDGMQLDLHRELIERKRKEGWLEEAFDLIEPGRTPEVNLFDLFLMDDIDQILQSANMIEVVVRQEDIESSRLDVFAEPEKPGARVEHDILIGKNDAAGMASFGRVIPGCAEESDPHDHLILWV